MIEIRHLGTTTIGIMPIQTTGISRREAERAAVAAVLSGLAPGAVLAHDADGAPYLAGDSRHVSISHSLEQVAVAIDPVRRIGIDLEDMSRAAQIERVLPRVLCDSELVAYAGRPLDAWTQKEALYKIAGNPAANWQRDLPLPPRGLVFTGRVGDSVLTVVASD